jgi:hypothetical protein
MAAVISNIGGLTEQLQHLVDESKRGDAGDEKILRHLRSAGLCRRPNSNPFCGRN